jgi:hAT family C-terminal dimerisation region
MTELMAEWVVATDQAHITVENPEFHVHVIYPVLSRIARDYLVIQASSIPSERAFSSCGHPITPKRSCLHHDTVRKSMFVKHYVRSRRQPAGAMIYTTLLDEK